MGTHRRHVDWRDQRRATLTLGPVTVRAHPYFWAIGAGIAVWVGIVCLFAHLPGM